VPWLKTGDNAATYPALTGARGVPGADSRTVNEVAGFVFRLAAQAAAHMTDYLVDVGTVEMIGGARTDELVRVAITAGLLTETTTSTGAPSYRIVEDPDFLHMRTRTEIEWERQQRNDTRDPRIKAPVLARDGDNCRRCGIGVHWRGKTSSRTGTLDHLHPKTAATIDTMFVLCLGCNSARKDNPGWDDDHPILPAPKAPTYGDTTAKYLTEHGYREATTKVTEQRPAAPTGSSDPAPRQGVRPEAPSSSADTAATATRVSRRVSDSQVDKSPLAGSGRDGTGSGRERDRTGRGGPGRARTGPDGLGHASGQDGNHHPALGPQERPPGARRRRGRRGARRSGGSHRE
jgi:hypothetical protein